MAKKSVVPSTIALALMGAAVAQETTDQPTPTPLTPPQTIPFPPIEGPALPRDDGGRAVPTVPLPPQTYADPRGSDAALAWITPVLSNWYQYKLSWGSDFDRTLYKTVQIVVINPSTVRAARVEYQCFDTAGESVGDPYRIRVRPRGARYWQPVEYRYTETHTDYWCHVSADVPILAHGIQHDASASDDRAPTMQYINFFKATD